MINPMNRKHTLRVLISAACIIGGLLTSLISLLWDVIEGTNVHRYIMPPLLAITVLGIPTLLIFLVLWIVEATPTGPKMLVGGDLTEKEIQTACRNIGYDITCGACAAIFYTGVGLPLDRHDPHCKTKEWSNKWLLERSS